MNRGWLQGGSYPWDRVQIRAGCTIYIVLFRVLINFYLLMFMYQAALPDLTPFWKVSSCKGNNKKREAFLQLEYRTSGKLKTQKKFNGGKKKRRKIKNG